MHEGVGAAERFGQPQRELAKPGQAHTPAKTNHRGFAGGGRAGYLGEGRLGHLAGMREHPVGDLPLGPAQAGERLVDLP